jgi:TonB family protein
MQVNRHPGQITFGLLPEPEGRSASFITSATVNLVILAFVLFIGLTARRVIEQHKFEQTELIFPTTPPPPMKIRIKTPPPPKLPEPIKPPEVKLEAPKIHLPKPEVKPALKPIEMEAKLNTPVMKAAKPSIVLAPQPQAALTAAMPAQSNDVKASTKPVHLGDTFGVTPNPNANRPATIAAVGNPYGGMQGPSVAPHGVVGSTGIGNGLKSGSNAGTVGRVASAGIPGGTGTSPTGYSGKVAAAGIPATMATAVAPAPINAVPTATNLEVLSKPPVQYTSEARQLRVEGNVILRVTFTANGRVMIQGVVHGLGHGLDEEARRVAEQIRFRPATRNGQAVDLTTNITITFQLA